MHPYFLQLILTSHSESSIHPVRAVISYRPQSQWWRSRKYTFKMLVLIIKKELKATYYFTVLDYYPWWIYGALKSNTIGPPWGGALCGKCWINSDKIEVLPSWIAPHQVSLAFSATASNFCQAQGVPKLSFSQIHVQQNLTGAWAVHLTITIHGSWDFIMENKYLA